jgi:hypothetical protein
MPRGIKELRSLKKKTEVTDDEDYLFWQFAGSNIIHIKEKKGGKKEYKVVANGKELTKANARQFIPTLRQEKTYRGDNYERKGESE